MFCVRNRNSLSLGNVAGGCRANPGGSCRVPGVKLGLAPGCILNLEFIWKQMAGSAFLGGLCPRSISPWTLRAEDVDVLPHIDLLHLKIILRKEKLTLILLYQVCSLGVLWHQQLCWGVAVFKKQRRTLALAGIRWISQYWHPWESSPSPRVLPAVPTADFSQWPEQVVLLGKTNRWGVYKKPCCECKKYCTCELICFSKRF